MGTRQGDSASSEERRPSVQVVRLGTSRELVFGPVRCRWLSTLVPQERSGVCPAEQDRARGRTHGGVLAEYGNGLRRSALRDRGRRGASRSPSPPPQLAVTARCSYAAAPPRRPPQVRGCLAIRAQTNSASKAGSSITTARVTQGCDADLGRGNATDWPAGSSASSRPSNPHPPRPRGAGLLRGRPRFRPGLTTGWSGSSIGGMSAR